VQATELGLRRIHGAVDLGLGGDIAAHEGSARSERSRGGPARPFLHIEQHHLAAGRYEKPCNRETQPGGAASDDGPCIVYFHRAPWTLGALRVSSVSRPRPPPLRRRRC